MKNFSDKRCGETRNTRFVFNNLFLFFENCGVYEIMWKNIVASWSSGQGLWLLIMRSQVRFPVLPWEFFLQGKIPVVTMVWVVSRFRFKAPPGISSSCISTLTSSGQRSRASWASQPQKSATLSPQPGGKPRRFIRTYGGIGRKINIYVYSRVGQATDDNIWRMRFACWITKATDTHSEYAILIAFPR